MNLLSRPDFKKLVFERDKNKCIFCKKPAVDAHHIFDRKLFKDGGYYLNNGASVCTECHWKCEKSEITIEDIWDKLGIKETIYPDGLDRSKKYDKWGKEI